VEARPVRVSRLDRLHLVKRHARLERLLRHLLRAARKLVTSGRPGRVRGDLLGGRAVHLDLGPLGRRDQADHAIVVERDLLVLLHHGVHEACRCIIAHDLLHRCCVGNEAEHDALACRDVFRIARRSRRGEVGLEPRGAIRRRYRRRTLRIAIRALLVASAREEQPGEDNDLRESDHAATIARWPSPSAPADEEPPQGAQVVRG